VEAATETKGSVREVPMLPGVKLALQQQRAQSKQRSPFRDANQAT
jgi:hypothetical protein